MSPCGLVVDQLAIAAQVLFLDLARIHFQVHVLVHWRWVDLHILPLPMISICTLVESLKFVVQFCYVQVAQKHKVQIQELLEEKSIPFLRPVLA